MTEQEKEWFEELVKDREENVSILTKDSMAGYRQSPINKYSDRAHFVYEFLQNADDVKASKCKFTLSRDGFLFEHNGIVPFKVSNPKTEGMDRRIGRLGGVNAITAAGLSTKSGNEIGRFGIGFKAVFQYTDEPRIYDDNIFFGLKNEIVPYLIRNDFAGRKLGETYFCVPFRSEGKDKAYNDIKEKIESITYPLLFLSNLNEISFETCSVGGQYTKEICDRKSYKDENQDIDVEFIILKSKFGDEETETKVLKFSTDTEAGSISVVFGINNNDGTIKLDSLQGPAFCFFPTKKDTGLNFLIHAPFLLNDSREGIKEKEEHNESLIERLALLSITAVELMEFKIPFESHNWFGRCIRGVKLVDDDILNYVPLKIETKQDEISLKMFELIFKIAFRTHALIPCRDGKGRELVYQKKENVCWSSDYELMQLFTSEHLTDLFGKRNLHWGFSSVNSVYISIIQRKFIEECCGSKLDEDLLRNKLNAEFFKKQSISWLGKFFEYIGRSNLLNLYKTLPIFLDSKHNAVSAFDEEGNHILYLPSDIDDSYTSKTILPELLEIESVQSVISLWNIKEQSRLSIISNIVRNNLVNCEEMEYGQGFIEVVKFCSTCTDEDLKKICGWLKKYPALYCYNFKKGRCKTKSEDCYYPTEELLLYFKGCEDAYFLDVEYLNEIIEKDNCQGLERLLSALNIQRIPKCRTELTQKSVDFLYEESNQWHFSYRKWLEKWEDFYIVGFKNFFEQFQAETDITIKGKQSAILWKFLCEIGTEVVSGHEHIEGKMRGIHHYYYDHKWGKEPYEPYLPKKLKSSIWLFNRHGDLSSHDELFIETLNEMYDVNSTIAKQLLEFLGIEHDERLRALNTLSDDERQDLEAARDIREAGIGSMAEAKSILGIIPEEIRQKISSGKLTAEKILKAVSLLELSEIGGCVPTIASKDSIAKIEQVAFPTTIDTISALTSDGKMGGLAVAEQHNNLIEAKKMVKNELELEGFEFTQGICEDEFTLINGVKKDGVEYPLVVHSYKDQSRPFQLTATDWEQLMKPKSMLIVCTKDGVCPVPFKNLVCNRDKIDFSISTKDNLDMSDRIASLAHVMRWFRGLRFDFGSLIPMEVGTAQLFDLPENPIPKGGIQAGSVEDL